MRARKGVREKCEKRGVREKGTLYFLQIQHRLTKVECPLFPAPPPLPKVDVATALKEARTRFQAREARAKLPLDEPSTPLLNQLLGPAKSVKETREALDRQNQADGKPPVYFLIAPHLDELLGPLPARPDVAGVKNTD